LKPWQPEDLGLRLKRALDHSERQRALLRASLERDALRKDLEGYGADPIVGLDGDLRTLSTLIDRIARTDSTVLIRGESGTGKELVAREIHRRSGRADHAFVRINCSAFSEGVLESELFGHEAGAFTGARATRIGRFEQAHLGTLFLDEIGDIAPTLQVKLLRVLQEREIERVGGNRTIKIDLRLLAASHRNLEDLVKQGLFREDLFFRINVVPLVVPPLRARPNDVIALTQYFVSRCGVEMGKALTVSAAAVTALAGYDFPCAKRVEARAAQLGSSGFHAPRSTIVSSATASDDGRGYRDSRCGQRGARPRRCSRECRAARCRRGLDRARARVRLLRSTGMAHAAAPTGGVARRCQRAPVGTTDTRIRRYLWLAVPLVDVPLVGLIQLSFVAVSIRPQAVAIFTVGIFAALVFVSQLAFSVISVGLTAVGSFACSVVLLTRVDLPLPNVLPAALLLSWAAAVAIFSGSRVHRLVGTIARAQRSREAELTELVRLRTRELTERNLELEQALASVARAQAELVRSERMASIAALVQGIAHELNNPIGYIANNIPPLQRREK
jgi:hypothetical protein